ncbi:guanine nucleotide-binding protein-like 1 isoform X2 [Fopius arisanus]|uniref:Guanine nucleotide-binding protein-like 1 n=1 Tax=Fopius arisanus TaxID=64838 RepID=A0A9R1TNC8_9HYME|nr:PREDICTED: guanine nucleotide-binding protein-like 1 isoform X2 [Fopius arisanus]
MPQGRRKAPFSGKAKKQQMQAKNHRKQAFLGHPHKQDVNVEDDSTQESLIKINKQPRDSTGRNRYALHFLQESPQELQQRKEEARKTIEPLSLDQQEVSSNYFPEGLDIPKRPPWNFSMSQEVLDKREHQYFTQYLKQLESIKDISYFEFNLETWRQLWRVLEMSDVLLIIVDIRYPVLMFPPYLYTYVTNDLKKEMILVLNKIDLAPPALVVAWREYFKVYYPKLHILFFTSFPKYNLRENREDGEGLKQRRRRGKLRMAAEGAQKLLSICKTIVGDQVDLSRWQRKIHQEMQMDYDLEDIDHKDNLIIKKEDTGYYEHEKYKNGVLTIGCIGTPNVGKSSLMNALMGKKVVREPYTTIKFIGMRLDLPKLLRIQHQEDDEVWSAMDICEGWAAKRNYTTARTARLDTYRAANSLLRMALEGKLCVFVYPLGWSSEKQKWENHEDIEEIEWVQASVKEGDMEYCEAQGGQDSFSEDEEEGNSEKSSNEGDEQDVESEEDDEESSEDQRKDLVLSGNRFGALANN